MSNNEMIIIGDSLIKNVKNIRVVSYQGVSLEKYIPSLYSMIDLDCYNNIVFCFGVNDLNNDSTIDELIANYNILFSKCKAENIGLILPPFTSFEETNKIINGINKDIEFYLSFTSNYKTTDGLHPNSKTLYNLEKEILYNSW